jgi:hypothetical protein
MKISRPVPPAIGSASHPSLPLILLLLPSFQPEVRGLQTHTDACFASLVFGKQVH